jgi:hypothetical protein
MPPDPARLRAIVEHLEAMERPSASPGERAAAEWIAGQLRAEGLDARIETEDAHGTYWVPLGLLSAAGALAGAVAARGGGRTRALAALAGAAAAAGIAEEVSAGPHLLRRVLRRRETANVVAEAGDPGASETLVFIAHHDAAHGGFIFDERFITAIADRFPDWYDRQTTSFQVMGLVAAGPALVALGSALGLRPLRTLGTVVSLGSAAAFADIAGRGVVPGANDNLTAVAVVLELARLLREAPVSGVRVVLLSTGSEESFMEGMRGWMRRHAASLPPDRTRFVCLESVGSPELIVIEGEGMLRMRDYAPEMRDLLGEGARRAGVHVRRGLRLGLATDGLIALRAGYRAAVLASITRYKTPANYHSHRDVAANVVWDTVRDATLVCEALVRSVADAAD